MPTMPTMPTVDDRAESGADPAEELIRRHYEHFNQRRLEVAARLFDPEARIEDVTGRIERGPEGYRRFAAAWLDVFPDVSVVVEAIKQRATGLYDIDLVATGTHSGTLAFGSSVFRATGLRVQLRAREILQIEDGRFQLASVSFDLQDLIRQLAPVDTVTLSQHIARIHQLGEQLAAQSDPARQRELLERLGRQLDLARHAVRPYFR